MLFGTMIGSLRRHTLMVPSQPVIRVRDIIETVAKKKLRTSCPDFVNVAILFDCQHRTDGVAVRLLHRGDVGMVLLLKHVSDR